VEVPPGGWTAQTFAAHGLPLLRAITRQAFLTQRRAIPFIARKAHELFKRQMDRVIARVLSLTRQSMRSVKAEPPIQIVLAQHEELWVQALNEVFAESGLEIVAELIPPIQSTMAQGYSKVSELLGHKVDPDRSAHLTRLANHIAQKITKINDTTRDKFRTNIQTAIGEGLSVAETAIRLRESMTEVHRSRITTIARTETNNAWTNGAAAAYKESETLTHVSVIGCESREEERWGTPGYPWMWRGESTCNAEDIPISELDAFMVISFHPNHTGTLIPSRFRNEDGTADPVLAE
jgi:hypothetical protein